MRWFLPVLGIVALLPCVSEASIASRIASAQPLNFLMEDDSRELFVDIDNSGSINAGDVLYGFAKVNQTSKFTPGLVPANNEIYAIFSQTFDSTFTFSTDDGGTPLDPTDDTRTYRGGFVATTAVGFTLAELTGDPVSASAMIAFLDRSNGLPFSVDGVVDVLATMDDYIDSYALEGTTRFTAGVTSLGGNALTNDFFRFRSEPVSVLFDPFADTDLIPDAQAGNTLGAFGAGLSLVDNFYAPGFVTFNEVVASSFDGRGALGAYHFSVSGGTFTGTDQNPANDFNPATTADVTPVQGGFMTFLDNADLTLNATVVPEPTSLAVWGGLMALVVGGVGRRFRKNRKTA